MTILISHILDTINSPDIRYTPFPLSEDKNLEILFFNLMLFVFVTSYLVFLVDKQKSQKYLQCTSHLIDSFNLIVTTQHLKIHNFQYNSKITTCIGIKLHYAIKLNNTYTVKSSSQNILHITKEKVRFLRIKYLLVFHLCVKYLQQYECVFP